MTVDFDLQRKFWTDPFVEMNFIDHELLQRKNVSWNSSSVVFEGTPFLSCSLQHDPSAILIYVDNIFQNFDAFLRIPGMTIAFPALPGNSWKGKNTKKFKSLIAAKWSPTLTCGWFCKVECSSYGITEELRSKVANEKTSVVNITMSSSAMV
ncbi:hypothetical protein TNCV_5065061 [Trichonephila clavipes]|nr:hypothetical protein TNCV_5065061 [Trichonephila clavipes]